MTRRVGHARRTIAIVITSAHSGLRNPWPAALVCAVLTLAASACQDVRAPGAPPAIDDATSQNTDTVRILSWNVSDDAFVRDPAAFRALMRRADADILLLDEVSPATTDSQLRDALPETTSDDDLWHIDVGASGGRQRNVIASRFALEPAPEFSAVVPYPSDDRDGIQTRMIADGETGPHYSMDGGIPVNGAIVLAGTRRLLVVSVDLQCCGNDPDSWQEERRQVEAREVRRLVAQVLARTRVDGVIVAGDLNLVNTPLPLMILSGPYPSPHDGLIAPVLRHLDGQETWTWDGRGTPFPSRPMDFVLYGPHALALREGYVLDSADLSQAELERRGLEAESVARLSAHRPVVGTFAWR
jgi:endonuclease/exonuclease/phosphatase family metal-dependent hydrolase